MIRLFLTLIVIFAFICVLTVIISIKSQKTVYPMVSVICGVMIIAFAFCCAIETESGESKDTAPTRAYIPVTESVSKKEDISTEAESEVRKEMPAKAEADETEEASYEDIHMVEKSIPEETDTYDINRTVYITKTGRKYHYSYFCSNTDFYECTLEQALERGLEPCQKCVK